MIILITKKEAGDKSSIRFSLKRTKIKQSRNKREFPSTMKDLLNKRTANSIFNNKQLIKDQEQGKEVCSSQHLYWKS